MPDHRSVIQTYAEALVGTLGDRGVDWVDWRIDGGHLRLDLHPQDAFPFQLRVVPGGDDTNCFVNSDLAGAFYMTPHTTVELDKPVVKEIRSLCEVILDHVDAALLEAVRSYASDDWSRIARVDQKAMVKTGYLHAAVITVPDTAESLERLAAEVPAMFQADDEFTAHFHARNPSAASDAARRPVYIGADPQVVRRLSELDKTLHCSEDAASKAAAILEMALLFGTPKCCAKAYAGHLATTSDEPDQIAFLRHVETWGGRAEPGRAPAGASAPDQLPGRALPRPRLHRLLALLTGLRGDPLPQPAHAG